MICLTNFDEHHWGLRPRSRHRKSQAPLERFRMARVKRGRSTNELRRRQRRETIGGDYRRRNKKVR